MNEDLGEGAVSLANEDSSRPVAHAGPARKPADLAVKTYCARGAGLMTRCSLKGEDGVTTAEYAVVLVAATSFAALLLGILKSDAVRNALENLIMSALNIE